VDSKLCFLGLDNDIGRLSGQRNGGRIRQRQGGLIGQQEGGLIGQREEELIGQRDGGTNRTTGRGKDWTTKGRD